MDKTREQQLQLLNLSNSPGWKILEHRINEQISILKNRLENEAQVDLHSSQSQIRAYKFVLRQIEEAKKK